MNNTEAEMGNTLRLVSMIVQMGLHEKPVRVPFMLSGDSGIGKTDVMLELADVLGEALKRPYAGEVWSGPQLQAEDASGLPVPDLEDGTTRLLPMRLGKRCIEAGAGLLCIDEFGSLSNSQEAAFLNLVQGGVLGELSLPYAIGLGAMMNPADIAANGRELSAPAANRFAWFDFSMPMSMWLDYMRGGRGALAHIQVLPEDWHALIPQTKGLIASYISRNPSELHRRPAAHNAGCAWPSPRSWDNAAKLLATVMSIGARKTSDMAALAVQSCVGEGSAESFMQWLMDMSLPDPEELLADPENAHELFPDRPDQMQVAMEALATAAQDKTRDDRMERWEKAWVILGPVFLKANDQGISGAKILAKDVPTGATYPPEAREITPILKQSGLIKDT